jgi:hypothetical protein
MAGYLRHLMRPDMTGFLPLSPLVRRLGCARDLAARTIKQAPILSLFLIVGAAFVSLEYKGVITEWRAMYPTDAKQQAALQLCYVENHQFNRMSNEDRESCYEQWLPRLPDHPTP